MKVKTSILLLLVAILSTFQLQAQADKERVRIDRKIQTIEFFLNKEGKLQTKLSIQLDITSQTSLSYRFKETVFFDGNSSVQNISKLTARKKKIKIKPIISDYESDGIFHSDLKLCYFDHLLDQSGEQVGFGYEKVFSDPKFLDPLYFNDVHSIAYSKVIIRKPSWLNLDIKELNFDKETPEKQVVTQGDSEIIAYTLSDVNSLPTYARAPRRNKLNAHLILIPTSYKSNEKNIPLMNAVGDLYDWYASLVDRIDNEPEDLKSIVTKLTANKENDLEKIKAIYYWVQDNIRYIAFENGIMGFQPESCQKVFNNKYGDCKGMANLTKEMLKIAGYDARLTWLGTNDLPYDYTMPSLLVDNHMICTVLLNGKKIYLDATEKYADLYNYAYRIRGKEVLIEDGDNYIIEKIPASDYSQNKEQYLHEFDLQEDQLVGKGKYSLEGNRKTWLLYRLSTIPEADWDKSLNNFLKNDDKNIKLSIKNKPNLKNRDKTPVFEYDISVANQVIDLGEEVYVNPEIEYEFYKFEMEEERDVPYEFLGTYFIEQETILNIPENWEVKYLPEALEIEHDKYSFVLKYQRDADKITYNKVFKIKDAMLATQDFSDWNKAIEKVTNFYSDQIILAKE
ncbi:MAG: transglutaminase domain-containing protein [Bacteroidota bacterium]